MTRFRIALLLSAIVAAVLSTSIAMATTKGLNQIVTPDIQPEGQLSISFQQADPTITNRLQAQFEYGFTKRFEMALFQGFSPDEQVLNAEYGIIQSKNYLLSAGFANWSSTGVGAQPYLEGGYLSGNTYAMIGVIDAVANDAAATGPPDTKHQIQTILGYAYRVHPRLLLQADFQSGLANYTTAGFTYNITPNVTFNPAIYLSNSTPYKGYGYAVVTWSITVGS
jgi:hypothetical protein